MDRVNPQTNPALAAGNAPPWYGPTGSAGPVANLTGMDRATGFSSTAGGTVTARHPVTPGQPIASSVQIKPGFTGTVQVGCDFYSSTAYLSSISGAADVVNGVVQRIGVVGIVPAGAVEALLAVTHNGGPAQFTAHLPEAATAIGSYFDGAAAATALQSAGVWDGTAGASTSRVTLLPQLVNSYPAEASGGVATLETAQFTPRQNEVVLAFVTAGAPDVTLGAAAAPGLTFAEIDASSAAAYTPYRLFRAVVGANPAATSVTVSTTGATGTRAPTLIVERWSYAQLAASPALSTPRLSGTTGGPSATLTTVAANSALSWFCGDYAGVSTTPVTYRGTAVEKYRRRITSVINVWSAWQRATSPAAETIGLSSPTGQKWAMVGVEVQPGPAPVEATTAQTSAPTGIPSAERPGSHTFGVGAVGVAAPGIGSGEQLGGHRVDRDAAPSGIGSAEQVGAVMIANGSVFAPSLPSAEQTGPPVVPRGTVTVAPAGLGSGEQVAAPTVLRGTVTVAPAGLGSAEQVAAPSVLRGTVVVDMRGGTSSSAVPGEAVPGAAVPGQVGGAPAAGQGLVSGEQVAAPSVLRGVVTARPAGLGSGEQVAAPTVLRGAVTARPAGLASGELFGVHRLDLAVHAPTGVATGEEVATPTVLRGTVTARPDGIPSGAASGAPTMGVTAHTVGVPSEAQTGSAVVLRGAVTVDLGSAGSSVPGAAVPGQAVPGGVGATGGIPTGAGFGAPTLSTGLVAVTPVGALSGVAFGVAEVARGVVAVAPAGITSREAFGVAMLAAGPVTVQLASAGAGSVLGALAVTRGERVVAPAPVGSGSAFGAARLTPGRIVVDMSGAGASTPGAAVPGVAVPGSTGAAGQGVPSGAVVSAPVLARGGRTATVAGIGSGVALGALTALRGAVVVAVAGVVSRAVCGVARVLAHRAVPHTGLGSGEAFGVLVIARGGRTVRALGVPGAATVGPLRVLRGDRVLAASSVPTREQLGAAVVLRVGVHVRPPGTISSAGFGTIVVNRGSVTVRPSGITVLSVISAPRVTPGVRLLAVAGVPSGAVAGAHIVRVHTDPPGISTAARTGRPVVHGATRRPGALAASWRTGGGLTASHFPN